MANGMHQAKQPVSALLTGPCGHLRAPHAGDRADRACLARLGALAVVTLLPVLLTAAGAT